MLEEGNFTKEDMGNFKLAVGTVLEADVYSEHFYETYIEGRKYLIYKDKAVEIADESYLQHFSKEKPEDTGEYVEVPKYERPESDHYHTGGVDVWRFADENFSLEEVTGFHRINILKYVTRYGKKKGHNRTDLEKARVMIDKLLELHDEHRS